LHVSEYKGPTTKKGSDMNGIKTDKPEAFDIIISRSPTGASLVTPFTRRDNDRGLGSRTHRSLVEGYSVVFRGMHARFAFRVPKETASSPDERKRSSGSVDSTSTALADVGTRRSKMQSKNSKNSNDSSELAICGADLLLTELASVTGGADFRTRAAAVASNDEMIATRGGNQLGDLVGLANDGYKGDNLGGHCAGLAGNIVGTFHGIASAAFNPEKGNALAGKWGEGGFGERYKGVRR
jgi:hypothetical protein